MYMHLYIQIQSIPLFLLFIHTYEYTQLLHIFSCISRVLYACEQVRSCVMHNYKYT